MFSKWLSLSHSVEIEALPGVTARAAWGGSEPCLLDFVLCISGKVRTLPIKNCSNINRRVTFHKPQVHQSLFSPGSADFKVHLHLTSLLICLSHVSNSSTYLISCKLQNNLVRYDYPTTIDKEKSGQRTCPTCTACSPSGAANIPTLS